MSEQATTSVPVIYQCPDCTGELTEQGIIWSCPNPHPEAVPGIEATSTPAHTAEEQKQ